MNNKERLESHKRMYAWLKEQAMKGCTFYDEEDSDWVVIENRYPELVVFIEDLLSHLESYVKREQEIFDIENHILWVDYRDYKFKIYLDAERNTLVGDILLNDEIDVIGLESDSLTHLLTELERQVDNQINYKYQNQLAEENIQLQAEIKILRGEYIMSINSDFYYNYKRRLEEAQKKPISQIKERAWLLENLAKELLNDLASEWLNREEYFLAVDDNEKEIGTKSMMKITFTYGDTVKIILTENKEGFYIYTPKNNITSPIKFFSVKDAILFFSEFLPINAYDDEEGSLDFKVTLEYKDSSISFYMTDKDKTKIVWTDYNDNNREFNDFLKTSKKAEDTIDDVIRYFIKWVETITESSCINLVQKILKNTPESANELFQLLLDFNCNVEEGIGEKEDE